MKKRILITGGKGYIASLLRLYNTDTYDFTVIDREDLDFYKPEEVGAYFRKADFDIAMNLAANANTAACENDPEGTRKINVESAIQIAQACQERGKRVVFIATEQCFNASPDPAPYAEDDAMGSVSAYGLQKIEVDEWIRANVDDYIILRFSWMFGLAMPGVKPSPSILGNVRNVFASGKPAKFRVNEHRNMTYAQDLADQLPQILELPSGAYHFCSQNGLNSYESARLVASKLGYSAEEIDRMILPDYETFADRPRDFRLNADKIKAAGIKLGTFEEDLNRCLADFGLTQ